MGRTLVCLCLLVASLGDSGCAATSAQQKQTFFNNVVSCVRSNDENASVKVAALNALMSGFSGDYAACGELVCPVIAWSIDEISCIAQCYETKSVAVSK